MGKPLKEMVKAIVHQEMVAYLGPSSVSSQDVNEAMLSVTATNSKRRVLFEENAVNIRLKDGISVESEKRQGIIQGVTGIQSTGSGLVISYAGGRKEFVRLGTPEVTRTTVVNHYYCCI